MTEQTRLAGRDGVSLSHRRLGCSSLDWVDPVGGHEGALRAPPTLVVVPNGIYRHRPLTEQTYGMMIGHLAVSTGLSVPEVGGTASGHRPFGAPLA